MFRYYPCSVRRSWGSLGPPFHHEGGWIKIWPASGAAMRLSSATREQERTEGVVAARAGLLQRPTIAGEGDFRGGQEQEWKLRARTRHCHQGAAAAPLEHRRLDSQIDRHATRTEYHDSAPTLEARRICAGPRPRVTAAGHEVCNARENGGDRRNL